MGSGSRARLLSRGGAAARGVLTGMQHVRTTARRKARVCSGTVRHIQQDAGRRDRRRRGRGARCTVHCVTSDLDKQSVWLRFVSVERIIVQQER